MTTDQALDLLHQLARTYKGTLEEHEALQAALKTLQTAVDKKK